MIRLSKKGWNNVLIFSMLIMIFMFNGLHHRLIDNMDGDTLVLVLPDSSRILTLDVANQVKIERIGPSWRSSPGVEANELNRVMSQWHGLMGTLLTEPVSQRAGYLLTIEVAGIESSMVVELVEDAELGLVLHDINGARWIALNQHQLSDLLPVMPDPS